MTDRQKAVYDMLLKLHLETKKPVSPTNIGLGLGFEYNSASPKCMNAIKKLQKLGLIKRVENGKYVPLNT